MATRNQEPKDETVNAQGAGAISDTNNDQQNEANQTEDTDNAPEDMEDMEDEIPQWVETLLASNDAVLESNEKLVQSNKSVIDAMDHFAEKGSESIKGIGSDDSQVVSKEEIYFDEDATYVVASGKILVDKYDTSVRYNEGDDVTELGEERIKALLAQGIVKEDI